MNRQRLKQQGFTLIEIMVVVAIIGILASIAIPSYTGYVKRGKAAEATSALADLRVKMEQCFQDTRDYTACAADCAPASGAVNFSYSCTTQTATTYTITATGNAAKDMSGFAYSVDQANAKTSTFDGNSGTGCWLMSKSGTC